MQDLVDMYINWVAAGEPSPSTEGEPGRGECVVRVVDLFRTFP